MERLLVVPLIAVVLTAPRALAAEDVVVSNPSFERWADGKPVGWVCEQAAQVTDKAHVRTGRSAMELTLAKGSWYTSLRTDKCPSIKAGTLYRVRVWAKGLGRFHISLAALGKGKADRRNSHYVGLTDRYEFCQFYYGVTEDRFRRLQITFTVDGVWTAAKGRPITAYLDDVSVEAVGKIDGPTPNVMPNGDMEAGTKAWKPYLPLKAPHARGPDGSRALASFAGRDPAPPTFKLDPKKWWDASVPRPVPNQWAMPVASPVFPVEPGRSYRLTMQTAGRGVDRLLCRLAWITTDGKPLGARVDVRTLRRHGTWGWEEDTIDFTVPTSRVKGARILFATIATGGWLWVDNVTVRPINRGAIGYRALLPIGMKPVKATVPVPAIAPTTGRGRSGKPAVVRKRPKSRVVGTRIELASGMTLHLRSVGKTFVGIGAVTIGKLALRNPKAPPIAPLLVTSRRGKYVDCRFVGSEVAADGTVTIRTALKTADGAEDRLDWIIESVEREIGGQPYVGFRYSYRARTTKDQVYEIVDRTTWELGGVADGVTVVTQNAYNLDNVFTIGPELVFAGGGSCRFAMGDGQDYQFTSQGALLAFYDEKYARMLMGRAATRSWVRYFDTIPFAGGKDVRTPAKCVLYAQRGNHDEWTRARDYVYDKFAAYWGVKRDTPMPLVAHFLTGRQRNVEFKGRVFQVIADKFVEKVAPLHFKVIRSGTLSGHRGLGMFELKPADMLGGMEGLKYLCDKAAKHGMKVQCWGPTARLSQASPIFKEHQDWLLKGPKGRPPTGYAYPTVRACRMRNGWMDYALPRIKKIREETGLAVLWLDSYANYTLWVTLADRRQALQQAEDLFIWHGKLSQMGFSIYTEAAGTLGVQSPNLHPANFNSPTPAMPDPATRYMASNYVASADPNATAIHRALFSGDYYFRLLANKGPCMVNWMTLKDDPAAQAKVALANKAYNDVVEEMVWRYTLSEDRGVEWIDPNNKGTRILFSYKRFRYARTGIQRATDVTTGKAVPVTDGGFAAEPMHVYRVTMGR